MIFPTVKEQKAFPQILPVQRRNSRHHSLSFPTTARVFKQVYAKASLPDHAEGSHRSYSRAAGALKYLAKVNWGERRSWHRIPGIRNETSHSHLQGRDMAHLEIMLANKRATPWFVKPSGVMGWEWNASLGDNIKLLLA